MRYRSFGTAVSVPPEQGYILIRINNDRYLVEIQGKHPVAHTVRVARCRCSSCGHTHAVHSSCLVPYRSYSLRFILQVLWHYFLHQGTVEQTCSRYGIAPSTLYGWKALFQKQKCLWLGILSDMVSSSPSFVEALDGKQQEDFQKAFGFAFLERFHRTDRETLFPGKKKDGAIT